MIWFVYFKRRLCSKQVLFSENYVLLEHIHGLYLLPSHLHSAILNERHQEISLIDLFEVELHSEVPDCMRGKHFPDCGGFDAVAGDAVEEVANLDVDCLGRCHLVLHRNVLQSLPEQRLATPCSDFAH